MLSLRYSTAFLLFAGTLAACFLIGWAYCQIYVTAHFIALDRHRETLGSMRRRYRRRLRSNRDAMLRHRSGEEQLREELRAATARLADEARQHQEVISEADRLRTQLAEARTTRAGSRDALEQSLARERALGRQLADALERLNAFERDGALLRIERDELFACTQRLRVLPGAVSAADERAGPGVASDTVRIRTELADRDARIHELQCALQDSATRIADLEGEVHRWKYRIAPLALHLKLKREKARQAAAAAQSDPLRPLPEPATDDLRRIRGIGRGLEKKLRAAGIRTLAQIAAMSPAELAHLAVRVGVAASRPVRDRWAEQAQALRRPEPVASNG
jgi:predicted flap endonuclease-1-like 5' DNA nuclease